MSRERHRGMIMEGLIMPTKIRKRGNSSSSSSSSRIHNHRLNKRAGKTRAGLLIGIGGSRSSTPVPAWRTTPLRSAVDSPKCSQSGRSTQPVSARRLAATLWEMNEMPSPKMSGSKSEVMKLQQRKGANKTISKREEMQSGWRMHLGSGYLPPHLSDPSHSPTVSERVDRSVAGSHQRTLPNSQRVRPSEQNAAIFDSISNASLMEVETRTHAPTSSGSISGGRSRLKDISNALTTSKELLKIINRLWEPADQPSSSMSVISALHAELEQARLQVNRLIKEQHSDKNEINYLIKCFAEEKASWKIKEQRAVEEAIESIADELEVERKLRRRLERLNKKLGKEIVDLKSSLMKAVEDLESEKRAREITEQVCSELARNIDEDRSQVEKLKSEPVEVHERAKKDREMLELEGKLQEESAWLKLSDDKRRPEEKNSALSKLRKQLEAFLGTKRETDEKRATYSTESNSIPEQNKQEYEDAGETKEDSAESDIQSIQSNKKNYEKSHRWTSYPPAGEPTKLSFDEIRARSSTSGQASRRSTSVLDGVKRERLQELEAVKRMGVKDRLPSSSRLTSARDGHSPSRQQDHQTPPRDLYGALQVKDSRVQATSSKSRLGEIRGDGEINRRSKR